MEFGKKGDAKKAMKLKWKEGITLKQAWKKIKEKDSKKRKTSKMSPRKRKAQSDAKKAMKLKWKEGITLKQAWKKINRFGDSVCPPDYEVNKKWTGKKGQRQCIQMCKNGMYRDPVTNRCKKNLVAPVMKQIPPGMELNPETGRLRKMCLPGEYRDPVSKRCRKIKTNKQEVNAPLSWQLLETPFMESEFRESTYVPPVISFGKYKKNRYGTNRCSFGSCSACRMG